MSPPRKKPIHVYVVSDATGTTAERVIQAVLVQFKSQIDPTLKRYPHVKSIKQLENIIDQAENRGGVLIYSIVSKELRDWIGKEKPKRDLEIIDLLGPLLKRMAKMFDIIPSMHPGLLGILGEHSIRLAEAIDFTLRHDDGQSIKTLGQADIIILGVSRTSKTPTSLYLACNHNVKVANVPIVMDLEPPPKIFTLKRPRKIGFMIEPNRLSSIRRRRFGKLDVDGYVDHKDVVKELNYCHRLFQRVPNLEVIDVTYNTIEETANKIVD